MVLVDTSVWIDYFRKIRNEPAQIAIEQRVPLLHSDKDFDRIRQVAPELQVY